MRRVNCSTLLGSTASWSQLAATLARALSPTRCTTVPSHGCSPTRRCSHRRSMRSPQRCPQVPTPRFARAAVERGLPFASVADHDAAITALLALDEPARARARSWWPDAGSRLALPTCWSDTRRRARLRRRGPRRRASAWVAPRARVSPRRTQREPRIEWREPSGRDRPSPRRRADLVPRPGRCARVRPRRDRRRVARGTRFPVWHE